MKLEDRAKRVVATATGTTHDHEIRDTIVPGFPSKVLPAGRETFILP